MQAFTLRFIDAARSHRSLIGFRWRVDEPYLTVSGRWRYRYRASDAHGQIVAVYLRDRRTADAARTFFQHAIGASGVRPTRVTTDKAWRYPKALQAEVPEVEHRSSTDLNNGLERDHHHVKGRLRPLRRFQHVASASNFCRGHTVIRHLARGHATLTRELPARLRLAVAWTCGVCGWGWRGW